ncbi:hypothetical protein H2203_005778 [Taxawa tesnikishii (nom. ined.)]|nr:hypothetical protein H2203_005778 [Dothideales sp. JES 119]
MHFFKTLALGASALASFAAAQSANLGFTSTPTSVKAGTPVTIKYTAENLDSPVTITLRKGDPNNLSTIGVLTSSATNGTYTWIPADSLADGDDYALQITQGNEINYSGEFSLSGGNASAISSAAAATSSSASAAVALTSSVSRSSAIESIQSIIASYNASLASLTASHSANATAVVVVTTTPGVVGTVGTVGAGTGTALPRNTTLVSATLSRPSTAATTSSAGNTAGTSGAGFQGSSTGSSASASASSTSSSSSGAAGLADSSPLALVLCAVAAFAYLN